MKKSLKVKNIFCIFFIISLVCIAVYFGKNKTSYKNAQGYYLHTYNSSNNANQKNLSFNNVTNENQVVYLSDIPYSKGQTAWGNITLDKTTDNGQLAMLLNGSTTIIKKGIWAHATSTLEYDISSYKDYAYFTTYYGINTTSGNKGNGVKFYIYTSEDGKNWTLRTEENPTAIKSSNNAVYVKIDIRDANYIRLYANDNGSNASDHAVWGDAKLVKEDYDENVMTTVEEYDEIIKAEYDGGVIKDDLKLTLLQRNFIKNVGQYQLRNFLQEDPKNKETLEWFINNEEALRLWTIGGKPSGTYLKSLQVLSKLYDTYKEDLNNEELTPNGTKYKDLYLKMMLSLSLSHAGNVGLWIGGNQFSDAVTRYDIYKQMHLNGDLYSNAMFESYTIDEMRGVMFVNIDDEEIMWLHDYSEKKFSNLVDRFNPFKYITYRTGYGYYRPQYYSQENYEKWDQKYNLSDYNITYQSGKPKLWIVFEEGSVCGGLSKTAANLYGVWGVPAYVVGQPAHAAYIYLKNIGGGNYAWQLSYNVASTAWAATDGRPLNGWGSKYNSGVIKTGSYRLLAQEAQNEYDKYEQAQLILLLEDVYKNDKEKQKQIYLDALEEERINFDAWFGLVNSYINDSTKTESDLIDLASEITDVYVYHPLPMYDLLKKIGMKVSSPEYRSKLMMLQDRTLRQATKATSADTIYHAEVPVIANAILGVVDSRIATFSFSGADAGKIVLSKQFQSAQVTWSYSLDGGNNWKEVYEHSIQLTNEEIASINANDDIKIRISGLPLTDENIFTININKGVFPSNTVSIDDLENCINGTTDQMEWTLDPNSGEWTSFADGNPNLRGDVVVYLRLTASGTNTTSDPVHYTFTMNASSLTNRFISRSNIEAVSASSTSKGNVSNILDGDMSTSWRSKPGAMFSGTYPVSSVVLKIIDRPRYVSELDYTPEQNAKTNAGNYISGRAKKINVYVSLDGKTWELAATKNNLANDNASKKITFPEPKEAQYIKIECTEVNGMQPFENFFSISVINLYENPSASEIPTAEISYNITNKTNKDVIAELVDENRPITVTNNDGSKTHTFTENGQFIFEFVDDEGNKGSATANVDWIDKIAPEAEVTFSTTELTNEEVVATITFSKENITVLSKDVQIAENPVDKSKTITFETNASYELEFVDSLGNVGTKTIAVDWIDKEAPTAELTYSTVNLTDQPVTVTMEPSEEVTVTNNDGEMTHTFTENGTFTFEFVDRVGNEGTATASVNWIAKVPEYTLTYSTTEPTNQDVTVTLELEEGYRIVSNNGSNTYTFTENGESSFEYVDESGNRGIIPIKVTWISKEENPDIPVEPTTPSFDVSLESSKETLNIGDEFEVNVNLNNMKNFKKGLIALSGKFEYDKQKLEMINILGENAWNLDQNSFNDDNFKFVTESDNYKLEEGIVFKVILKVKETIEVPNEVIFKLVDIEGSNGDVDIFTDDSELSINIIEKEKAPVPTITYSTTELTNQDVVATITFDKENVTVEGGNTHTFTENGEYTFTYRDQAGNEGTAKATVTWIDKVLPVATISYNITSTTNQDVVATVTFDKENVTVEGGNTHTFTENGEYTFTYRDQAGNEGTAKATVTWIDKVLPVATISYNITSTTNQDVVATVTFDKENVTVEGGNTHTFTENGEYTFTYRDQAGNEGTAKATVTWIDKVVKVAIISYDITSLTNQNVTASISFNEENITITNNEGNNTYVFTENGEFIFEYRDEAGNEGTAKATVTWIDKVAPVPTITYSTTELTNQDVVATITFDKENVTVEGGNTHTFTENGEYTFTYRDQAGNEGTAKAAVTWIEKEQPEEPTITSNIYTIKDSYISRIEEETTVAEFKQKVEANMEITIVDNKGNKVEDDAIICTGMIVKIGEKLEYTAVVIGDINGDGKISITDIAKIKLHLIEKEELTGASYISADINANENVTITDLAQIKLIFLELPIQ